MLYSMGLQLESTDRVFHYLLNGSWPAPTLYSGQPAGLDPTWAMLVQQTWPNPLGWTALLTLLVYSDVSKLLREVGPQTN
ncbi:hypothetical protein PanWU01x14_288690 [Parasponia andersonii]|uniref:Uncharacterized protein n=1 Tax=Parasponia andersonii TaxID=3476 RepID=A0A2P5AYI9_PARAD|nr:hypothetical protein PanWU01x14_288690 [Parasponia andersonii]